MSIIKSQRLALLPDDGAARTYHSISGSNLPVRYLVLEEQPEGIFIFRYAEDGKFAGDTWHLNENDALAQVKYEFGTSEFDWQPVSEEQLSALIERGK